MSKETYLDRMKVEAAELSGRVSKLEKFIGDAVFTQLDDVEKELLHTQFEQMKSYYHTLVTRIGHTVVKQG